MRRYDKDSDGRLKYKDFSEMFTPLHLDYSSLLNKREPISQTKFNQNSSTVSIFRIILRVYLKRKQLRKSEL
jgi:hypothetical protein